jgi:cytochrome c1
MSRDMKDKTMSARLQLGIGALGFAVALFGFSTTGFSEAEKTGASSSATPPAAEEHHAPARQSWSFWGPFGKFDQAQLQRGFKIYKEVCSNCHSINDLAFRNLADEGGPGFSEAQVKALAETYKVKDGPNDAGEMFERPGRPSDHFPPPFPNKQAAIAALGAAPPDMSVLAKARAVSKGFPYFITDAFVQYQEAGPDYIYAILNGYTHDDDPNFDEAFPGHHIAMPKPLADGQVEYTDGTPATLPQYAKDISAFLMWAAEPKLEERKEIGLRVMVFLIVFATLLYFVKKRIWAKVHDDAVQAQSV